MNHLAYHFQLLRKFIPYLLAYLLVAIIGLQSAFSMTAFGDFCDVKESVSNTGEYQGEMLNNSGQQSSDDDCAQCSCKSCPCCLNITLAQETLLSLPESVESLLLAFEATGFDSPYYLLLRPPKI